MCFRDYRPINLCKTLANRLKKELLVVISHNQIAFFPERLITDNVIFAYEALHTMKVRQKGQEGSMALTLNMCKAYDRVE